MPLSGIYLSGCHVGVLADVPQRMPVESRTGASTGATAPPRFPSPLIKPDVRICRIRLSDWFHRRLTNARPSALGVAPPHRTEHPFLRELAGALRRHLVTPPQKVPHFVIDMLVNRPVRLARGTAAEVCSPAFQYLIQPLAHLFPWLHVARHQQLSHFRLDPGHALLRRTVPDILPPRSRTVV